MEDTRHGAVVGRARTYLRLDTTHDYPGLPNGPSPGASSAYIEFQKRAASVGLA